MYIQRKIKQNNPFLRYAFLFLLLVLHSTVVTAQSVETANGVVVDATTGEAVIGATIMQKGTSNGVVTDIDGAFSINLIPGSDTLLVTYVGFADVEILAGPDLSIELSSSAYAIDEVIVIGYGSARKSDLTGSISTLEGTALQAQPIAEIGEALTGRLAGVQVTSSDGAPGTDISIRIRGAGSITQSSEPLIIVDGFPIDNLSDISPSDIASISVLKDASSTAIYGSRGANGVILITTKNAAAGKVTVDFNSFIGARSKGRNIDVLQAEDYLNLQYELALMDADVDNFGNLDLAPYERFFGTWSDRPLFNDVPQNNWQEIVFGRQGLIFSNDLAIRGGTDELSFKFNYNNYNLEGIVQGSDYNRNTLSLALKNKASKRINLSFRLRYSDTEIAGGGGSINNAISYSPIPVAGLTSPFDETNPDDEARLNNPLTNVNDNNRLNNRRNFNMGGSLEWKLSETLQLRTNIGFDYRNTLEDRYYGGTTSFVRDNVDTEFQGLPALRMRDTKRDRIQNATTLEYDFKNLLPSDHNLKILGGQEWIVTSQNRVENVLQGFPEDFGFEQVRTLTTQGDARLTQNLFSPDDKLFSLFSRLNYDYKNRYLLTATFRADGSSKFLGDNIWGYFPSLAAAWKVNEEGFLKNSSWVDLLKLRVSYGEVGNNGIPTGQTVQTFGSTQTVFLNDISSIWVAGDNLANPLLKWETTVTQNIGLDFGLFKGKLYGAFELYNNKTKDLLIQFPVDGTGFEDQFRNIGEVQNSGFETTLNYQAISKDNYGLDVSFNIGVNTNKVNSLGELVNFAGETRWASSEVGPDFLVAAGQQLGLMYGYITDGRYEVSDFNYDAATREYILKEGMVDSEKPHRTPLRPGTLKLVDITGDGIVDEDDRTIIGDANPDFVGGFSLNGRAYGFDVQAAFNFSVGFDVYNASKLQTTTTDGLYENLSAIMQEGDRWTNLDVASGQLVTDPSELAALNSNTTLWHPLMQKRLFHSWGVEDGSFLRLNTLAVGYTIPEEVIQRIGISRLRFYATATNLFLWTNYSGADPEVNTFRGTTLTPNVDINAYPRGVQMVFGANVSF